ncbi:MAG: Omp28-related outer membrane protein [Chitinophagales bacterium]
MKSYPTPVQSFVAIFSFVLLFFMSACEEIPPLIDFSEPAPIDLTCGDKSKLELSEYSRINTSFVSSELPETQCKMVLIEEFSGVRCVNCPAGHQTTAEILQSHPDEVAAITIHAGFLSTPYNENKEDYVIPEGTTLYDLFQTIAVPAAAVDRVKYEGEDFVSLINRNVWAGKVNERLQLDPPMNVYTNFEYNPSNRNLQVFVRVHYLQAFDAASTHLLSVSLSESDIVDYQLTPTDNGSSIVLPDYIHDHVLRAMLTPASGLTLGVDKIEGTVVERVFNITLPDNWKVEDMEIIAFVHDGTTNNVLQAAKKHIE